MVQASAEIKLKLFQNLIPLSTQCCFSGIIPTGPKIQCCRESNKSAALPHRIAPLVWVRLGAGAVGRWVGDDIQKKPIAIMAFDSFAGLEMIFR